MGTLSRRPPQRRPKGRSAAFAPLTECLLLVAAILEIVTSAARAVARTLLAAPARRLRTTLRAGAAAAAAAPTRGGRTLVALGAGTRLRVRTSGAGRLRQARHRVALPAAPALRLPSILPDPAVSALVRDGWTVIVPRQPGPTQRLYEAWRYRRLIRFFGMRLVAKTTVRSKLGLLWVPIRPLLNVGSRALIFGGLLGASSGRVPYFLFFLTGMAGWSLFERGLFWSVRSIEINSKLLQKLYFPRMLLPLAAFVPALLDFAIYLVLVVIAVVAYGLAGHWYLVASPDLMLVPVGLLLLALITFGVGLVLAVLGAHARDVRFALSYVLGFAFFLTPVIYPFASIPGRWAALAGLNPLTAPLEMIRLGLYGYGEFTSISLGICLAVTGASCTLGLLFFSRWEATAVDAL